MGGGGSITESRKQERVCSSGGGRAETRGTPDATFKFKKAQSEKKREERSGEVVGLTGTEAGGGGGVLQYLHQSGSGAAACTDPL